MPLSTGATWPALRAKFTAAAEDLTAKFEWLEGHRLPMDNGVLTSGAFDIGSTAYQWKDGNFSGHLEFDSLTITSSVLAGNKMSAWAYIDFNFTILNGDNVSSVTFGATGAVFYFTTPMGGDNYVVNGTRADSPTEITTMTADYVGIKVKFSTDLVTMMVKE